MATLTKTLSYEQLKQVVAEYIDSNKISNESLSITRDNIVGLVDKIGRIVTLDHSVFDKLEEFNGDALSLGKTIEEWAMDMTLPIDFDEDSEGNKALKNYTPTFRPVYYSTTLGRKILPTSIPYGNVERAVNNESEFASVVAQITKKLDDSKKAFEYQCKRQLIGELIAKVEACYTDAISYVAGTTALVVGKTYKNTAGTSVAVAMFDKAASSDTFETLVANGKLVILTMKHVIAKPVDEATGEAFIKQLKKDVEVASDLSQGNSLNGGTLGADNHLKVLYRQGVVPSLEVDTMAGAFNLDKLETAPSKVIKDFGNNETAFCVLIDDRIFKLHPGYEAVRSQENGYGDRINLFRHMEYTGYVSRNAFINIYVEK